MLTKWHHHAQHMAVGIIMRNKRHHRAQQMREPVTSLCEHTTKSTNTWALSTHKPCEVPRAAAPGAPNWGTSWCRQGSMT